MEEILEKIKVHAGKVKDGAVKLTHKVIGKTNNVVDQTKVKFAISDTQNKINELFAEVGREIYACHTNGSDSPDFSDTFAKLGDLHNEVEDLCEQLSRLKNTKQCPACNTYNDKNNEYCAKCGEKLSVEDEAEDTADEVVTVAAEDVE